MTPQETFDFVISHLWEQGGPSTEPEYGTCLYRAPNGRKCAAGWLIPDDDYHPTMEGDNVFAEDIKRLLKGHDLRLVVDLQMAHDDFTTPDWPLPGAYVRFKQVAERYNLDTNVLDKTFGANIS